MFDSQVFGLVVLPSASPTHFTNKIFQKTRRYRKRQKREEKARTSELNRFSLFCLFINTDMLDNTDISVEIEEKRVSYIVVVRMHDVVLLSKIVRCFVENSLEEF